MTKYFFLIHYKNNMGLYIFLSNNLININPRDIYYTQTSDKVIRIHCKTQVNFLGENKSERLEDSL